MFSNITPTNLSFLIWDKKDWHHGIKKMIWIWQVFLHKPIKCHLAILWENEDLYLLALKWKISRSKKITHLVCDSQFSSSQSLGKWVNGVKFYNLISVNPILHGHGPFYMLVLFGLDFVKLPNFVGGENSHQSGWFDTLPSSLSLIYAPRWRYRWAFFSFKGHVK